MTVRLLLRKAHRQGVSLSRGFSSVHIWGNGNDGQLGLGEVVKVGNVMPTYDELTPLALTTLPLDEDETVVEFAGGQNHSLAVTSAGRLFAWGSAGYGKLGLGGDSGEVLLPKLVAELGDVEVVSAACGDNHSAVVDSDGGLYTWGFNGSFFSGGGMLGHGNRDAVATPKRVESLDEEGIQVRTVTAGELHTAILTIDGEVMTCGAGEYGRLGLGGALDEHTFLPVDYLSDVDVTQLVSGHAFSIALTEQGDLFGWGRNDQGQLGQGGTMSLDVYSMNADPVPINEFLAGDDMGGSTEIEPGSIAFVAAGHSHAACVTKSGELYMWGMKTYLSPQKIEVFKGDSDEPETVQSVTLGQNFTVVTNATGEVFTFGNGNSKCLGHGDTKNSFQPKYVEALEGRPIAYLRAGHNHVVAFEQPPIIEQ